MNSVMMLSNRSGGGNGVAAYSSWDAIWEDSTSDPGAVAVAILSGFWAFGGWNYLNFLTGELKVFDLDVGACYIFFFCVGEYLDKFDCPFCRSIG